MARAVAGAAAVAGLSQARLKRLRAYCSRTHKLFESPSERTLRRFLEPLSIEGRLVTADALHTQRETARFLVNDKQAHYVFTVKDNHKSLRSDLQAFDWKAFPPSTHHRR